MTQATDRAILTPSRIDESSLARAALAFDVVAFAADCPTCGGPAEWFQRRENTRSVTRITCAAPHCLP